MSSGELHAAFFAGGRGRIFAIARRPQAQCDGVLFVPPFAEEMNKSRHVFTEVAVGLAAHGIGSVLVDLYGTGDSEGEFAESDWSVWKADLTAAVGWAAQQGIRINRLLGIRLGCVLGAEVAAEQGWVLERSVFLQPVLNGARALDQFLRVRVAASLMQKDGKETVPELRSKLKSGETLEVAGYDISSTFGAQMDAVDLASVFGRSLGALAWIELVRSADGAPPMPSMKAVEHGRSKGLQIDMRAVPGEPFWSSVEIVRNPELIRHTVSALGGGA